MASDNSAFRKGMAKVFLYPLLSLLLLPALRDGPARNGELLRRLEGISQKVLTQTLRELERNRLVTRSDHGTRPLFVEYALTPLGASLSEVLLAVDRWVEAHHEQLGGG